MTELYPDITIEECERMQSLSDDGLGVGKICDEVGRSRAAVSKHINGRCQHGSRGLGGAECPLCGEECPSLPWHLPSCEGAASQ